MLKSVKKAQLAKNGSEICQLPRPIGELRYLRRVPRYSTLRYLRYKFTIHVRSKKSLVGRGRRAGMYYILALY